MNFSFSDILNSDINIIAIIIIIIIISLLLLYYFRNSKRVFWVYFFIALADIIIISGLVLYKSKKNNVKIKGGTLSKLPPIGFYNNMSNYESKYKLPTAEFDDLFNQRQNNIYEQDRNKYEQDRNSFIDI